MRLTIFYRPRIFAIPIDVLLSVNKTTVGLTVQTTSKGIVFGTLMLNKNILMKNLMLMTIVGVGITSLVACQKMK